MIRRNIAYLFALVGVAVLTLAVGIVRARVAVPNLSLVYLLLVLWLGATYGSGPAVAASVLSFLAYDFFFVPPAGTFTVSAPNELLGLGLLLAAGLVTGQLAASARQSGEKARRSATESRNLYELATAALRLPDVEQALALIAERSKQVGSVSGFTVLAAARDDFAPLAGPELIGDSEREARWAYQHNLPIGIQLNQGAPQLLDLRPRRPHTAMLPVAHGVIAIHIDGTQPNPDDAPLLQALVSLAGLLVDRWVAGQEAERLQTLEATDQLKTAILSSLSHELKTPLAVLRTGLSSLTMPQSGLPREERELVRDLDREASHLDRLIGDLLAMSRLEAGGALRLERLSFPELVGAVLDDVRPRMGTRRLEIAVPSDLPAVLMDEAQIGRVLTNLLENAIDWTPETGSISITAHASAIEMTVCIDNDGPAIAPTELQTVFDKFWTRRAGGSGLGLAISKRIIEAHGGRIRAQNLRPGPRFTFTLQLAGSDETI